MPAFFTRLAEHAPSADGQRKRVDDDKCEGIEYELSKAERFFEGKRLSAVIRRKEVIDLSFKLTFTDESAYLDQTDLAVMVNHNRGRITGYLEEAQIFACQTHRE